nr:MAG TPA: hypothetical protein [Caudoviricetes sp.]
MSNDIANICIIFYSYKTICIKYFKFLFCSYKILY